MEHEVQDGPRILKFDGEELAFSTSQRHGSERWVEFTLYRTDSGKYVVSRVGASNVYHAVGCRIAESNLIPETPRSALEEGAVACQECRETDDPGMPLVCVEKDRTSGNVYATVQDLVRGLSMTKPGRHGGTPYITGVARRLLERAAARDAALADPMSVERVT